MYGILGSPTVYPSERGQYDKTVSKTTPFRWWQTPARNTQVRRKNNQLVRNERIVLSAAMALSTRGDTRFHGYSLTELWKSAGNERSIMNYATMYRCLNRLQERGMLTSEYEQRETSGPPRRMFTLTGDGVAAAAEIDTSDITAEVALFKLQ